MKVSALYTEIGSVRNPRAEGFVDSTTADKKAAGLISKFLSESGKSVEFVSEELGHLDRIPNIKGKPTPGQQYRAKNPSLFEGIRPGHA